LPSFDRKRRLDTTLGGPICAVLNLLARLLGALLGRDHSLRTPPRRILVIKVVGLGSIVHSTLLLRALKTRYPDASLAFLCFSEAQALVERLPDVDEVTALDDSTYLRLLISTLRWLSGLRRRPVDLVIDLEVHSKFSTILATLTCARDRAGHYLVTARFRDGLYTHLVFCNRLRHVQEAYRQLGRSVGATPQVGQPLAPRIEDDDRTRLGELVNVNAGELCLERRWPPEQFAELMARFAARPEVLIVMSGSPAEAEYTNSVHQLLPPELRERVVMAAGRLSFGEFLALLERADVLLSNDTGPLHLAVALGVPTVSLWGPVPPETYGPLTGEHRVHWARVYCSPCLHWADEPPCAGANVCMKRIEWRAVARDVAELLGLELALPEPARPTEAEPTLIEGYVQRKSAAKPAEPEPTPNDEP
jgi:ADP-heptose:LPS heptosyltransferase